MENLGEDIVLLALCPDGRLAVWDRLRFALAGSELVRLAASGRVAIVDDRLEAPHVDSDSLEDPMLINALTDIRQAKRAPMAGD